jgi:hypothetical protein
MQSLDIERLVQWAYRVELPKARRSSFQATAPSAWSIVERHLALGVKVDVSAAGARAARPAIGDDPHPDALIVERVVDGLSRGALVDWPRSAASLLGEFAAFVADAEPAVARYTFNEFALVVGCAESAARPSWRIGQPQVRPACGKNGKPALVGTRFASARYSIGARCPLEFHSPSIDQVIIARAAYAVWHAGLTRLAADLKGRLRAHIALSPTASAQPWNSRVLPSQAAA